MIGKCSVCGKFSTELQRHHLFSNTKLNRKLYGEMIEDFRNIARVCEACHLWKPIPKYTELEFCEALGIKPRSKTYGKQA